MRRILLIAALCAFVLPPAAAADPPDYGIVRPTNEKPYSKLELGKVLYAGNCSMCHGSNGEGVRTFQPARASGAMRGQGPSLQDLPAGLGTVDLYLRAGYMPLSNPTAQPHRSRVLFEENELEALIAYVGTLQRRQPPEPIPEPHPERGNVSRGQSMFTEHCAGCHQVVAQGGYVTGARVPPLEDDSAVEIAECVRSGPYTMPTFSKQTISDAQLDDIIAYVEYTKDPAHPGGWPLGYLGPLPEGMVTWFVALVALVTVCVVIGKRLRSE